MSGMPRERHQACPTRMHDSLLLSFQGYVLNHDLILLPGHLFEGDMGLLNEICKLLERHLWGAPLLPPILIGSRRLRDLLFSDVDLINKVNLKSAEVSDLNASLQEKILVDVAPLVLKLHKNRTAHTDYIRHTQDEAATLREIVESERLLSPLNTSLDYACKYTRWIQEFLMILQQTCPSLTELGTKLVAITPKNKTKQIGPTEQITKSGKTNVTTPPLANLDSNTPMLSSTRVILVSSASGSMSQDNTKKNRIRRTQRKAKKNKIEDHLRTVKSSLIRRVL
nr:hypothetical protein [Tanacetum cinerariifolium]